MILFFPHAHNNLTFYTQNNPKILIVFISHHTRTDKYTLSFSITYITYYTLFIHKHYIFFYLFT